MNRAQLEHLIRAAGTIADIEDIVVIGSQSILGEFPDAPTELLISQEADMLSLDYPERAELIDSTIGEGSPFQNTFGYYSHGVDLTTAILPNGWRERLILVSGVNTKNVRGWCLEVHDLAIAKYVAGREKDLVFLKALAKHDLVRRDVLEQRLEGTTVSGEIRTLVRLRIEGHFKS